MGLTYRVVFDFAAKGNQGLSRWNEGLIFVGAGVLLVMFRNRLRGWWGRHPQASKAYAFFWLGISCLGTAFVFAKTRIDYSRLQRAVESGHADVVEGPVEQFMPVPENRRGKEHFCVRSACFEYSDSDGSLGFNNMSIHGGPIREGLAVRVTYVENTILKLEIAKP